jgi:hypothetical protein
VKGANLESHLAKVHPDPEPLRTEFRGVDHATRIPALVGILISVFGLLLVTNCTSVWGDVSLGVTILVQLVSLALLLSSLLGWLPGRLTVGSRGLELTTCLGLVTKRLSLPPGTVETGRLMERRTQSVGPHHEEFGAHDHGVGVYVRLRSGRTMLTLGGKNVSRLAHRWIGVPDGRKRRHCDAVFDRSALVAVEYALAAHGVLRPKG